MSKHRAYEVPVVPGRDIRSVTNKGAKGVTGEYGCQIHRADTPRVLQRVTKAAGIGDAWTRMKASGLAPILLALALCLLADAAVYAAYVWPG